MKTLETLKANLRNTPVLMWVFTNLVGWGFANHNYLSPFQIPGPANNLTSPSMLTQILPSVVSGLIIGLVQLMYFKVFGRTSFSFPWGIRTCMSTVLIFVVNTFIFPGLVFPWLFPILSNLFSPIGYSLHYLTGVEIYTKNIFEALLQSSFIGALVGGCVGAVLGLLQAGQIPDPKLAKKWFYSVVLSVGTGYVICSVLITIISSICSCSVLIKMAPFLTAFIGFLYALGTSRLMKKLLSSL